NKEFDAYVLLLKSNETLLSAKEETFALELLPEILEQKFGYRLCIFERDVLPGGASANDILSYINKCRRLIIVLCAECMADDSSMYELMTGLHQALVERTTGLCLKVYILAVQTENQTNCQDAGNCEVFLIQSTADIISCPEIQHFNVSASFPVKWYKNKKIVEEYTERPSLKIKGGQIHLNTIYELDSGNYTCIFNFIQNHITWIVKRTFTVRVVVEDTKKTPTVIVPHGVKTIEAELGQPVQLTCKVYFGYERKFDPVIKWLINGKEEAENMRLQHDEVQETKTIEGFTLIWNAHLSKVTEEDFSTNFTCFSQNSQGNSSGELRLKEKESNIFQIKVITISTLLIFVTIVCGCVGVYKFWIEIVLIYRHYFSKDETVGDGKEFDAFVSYANTSSLGEDDESNNHIITEEMFALELLPFVLEKQYGYKLCLFERDVLPGGVYTEDVISSIKRSRRVIIVLSPNYIARNGSKVFELQTGKGNHSATRDNVERKQIFSPILKILEDAQIPYASEEE
ncbi:hypothetical protein scyTo_0015237, partial [Scyliorhinus torazame]|nr:hypothetical protein [Scyliorhinus torazame]